jgi:hypothetical protein
VGRPLVGARWEHFLGCSHAPAAGRGTTDASGELNLRGADPDLDGQLWIVAEGVDPGPYDVVESLVGPRDAPPMVLTAPGRTARGVVLGADGKPLPGVVVRGSNHPRGPAARTGKDGRFLLWGIPEAEEIWFFHPENPPEADPALYWQGFEDGVPLRVVLRAGVGRVQAEEEPGRPVEVLVGPAERVPVRLTRLDDGWSVLDETVVTADGERGLVARCRATVPAGRYRVTAGGAFSPLAATSTEVLLPRAEPVELDLERQPRLRLVTEGVGAEIELEMRTPLARSSGETDGLRRVHHVPAEGPAAVWVRDPAFSDDSCSVVPIGAESEGARTARVVLPVPTRIRVVLAGADGEHIEGELPVDFEWDEADEFFGEGESRVRTILTYRTGPALLHIEEEDYRTAEIPLDLPDPSGGRVDVGEIVLEIEEPAPPAPLGGLAISVSDPEGRAIPFVAYLDSERYEGKDGRLGIGGLADGPHLLVVGAKGRRGEARRIVIRDGEQRELDIVLPAR